MQTPINRRVGIAGIAIGLLAIGTETFMFFGISDGVRAAWFRTLFGLSVIMLLGAILLTVTRLTQAIEEQPTRVQPVIDAFMAGVNMRDTPAGKRARGHSGGTLDLVGTTDERQTVPTRYPQDGSDPER